MARLCFGEDSASSECYYLGAWGGSGMSLRSPGGWRADDFRAEHFTVGGDRVHLDAALAPKRERDGTLTWAGRFSSKKERERVYYDLLELPQGQFLLHHLDNGFTAIQWWDRCQGDGRGGINSTILLRRKHSSTEMLEALREHFPKVLANLEKAGVRLEEVKG